MPNLKLTKAFEGQTVTIDNGFTCHPGGKVIIEKNENGLYFPCEEGKHYLSGQADDGIHCVGITSVPQT